MSAFLTANSAGTIRNLTPSIANCSAAGWASFQHLSAPRSDKKVSPALITAPQTGRPASGASFRLKSEAQHTRCPRSEKLLTLLSRANVPPSSRLSASLATFLRTCVYDATGPALVFLLPRREYRGMHNAVAGCGRGRL